MIHVGWFALSGVPLGYVDALDFSFSMLVSLASLGFYFANLAVFESDVAPFLVIMLLRCNLMH